jgi:hypothetical protein
MVQRLSSFSVGQTSKVRDRGFGIGFALAVPVGGLRGNS